MRKTNILLLSATIFLIGTPLVSTGLTAHAESSPLNQYNQSKSKDLKYNPENPVYIDGNYVGKIVISEIPKIETRSMIHTETVQDKDYNVHFIGVTANVGFGITVSNSQITNAYDPWSNGIGWAITPGDLTFTATEARLPGSFSIAWEGFPAGSTFRLRAVINGNQLETHLDIP
ncbi:DUF5626 family protein [Enterococcus faecalis]